MMNLPMCDSLVPLGNCQEREMEKSPALSHILEQFNLNVGNGAVTEKYGRNKMLLRAASGD